MKEIYSWVPWFRELAEKIEEGGEAYLIEKAKQVEWGEDSSLLEQDIDPFSFFYFLASKNTNNQRKGVYDSVSREFEIKISPPPVRIEDYYLFPTPYKTFYDGTNFYHDLLWRLFREAVKGDLMIGSDDFKKALEIGDVGVAKLTQTLFLINPKYFLPVDNSTEVLSEALGLPALSKIENEIKDGGYEKYLSVLKKIKKAFPGCQPYEINMFLYLQKSGQINNSKIFQIDTIVNRTDSWDDFKENNWVYTSGPGSGKPWGETGDPRKYHLTKPKRGDIILVRTGRQKKGRAIGLMLKNDYAESGLNENSRIHVLWINKSTCDLSGHTDERKFREAKPGGKTYLAFEKTDGYKPSFHLINSLTGNSIKNGPKPDIGDQPPKPDTMEHSHTLNQILYGPPGTGKTWNTVNHAVAIIEDKPSDEIENDKDARQRFRELKKDGQIAMVTFHQNFTYEDFIEGIRPVLVGKGNKNDEGSRDVEYKLHKGVFREIVDQAREDRDQNYVLIIDEINRGNIAKVFGELITLIESSKRIGGDDEATATLPYSQDSFGVPDNLYIIGTMNTADRSIAPLDTALRRRFKFVEMMPDLEHHKISTDIEGVNCQELLDAMNKRIHFLFNREHQIGHTYFMGVDDLESLAATFKNKIIPLLQEYFYDNWEKIDLVLNRNGFVHESLAIREHEELKNLSPDDQQDLEKFALENQADKEGNYRPVLQLSNGKLKAQNYVGIIETHKGTVLEILPKVDFVKDEDEEKTKTKEYFFKMLRDWRGFKSAQFNVSHINAVRRFNMLEVFVHLFLNNLVLLTQRGLTRHYQSEEDNQPYLRGRILFPQHIRANIANRAQFYVGYDEFSTNRPANRLIHSTIHKLMGSVRQPRNQQLLHQLRINFSDIPQSSHLKSDWDRHQVDSSDRSMQHYDEVMQWVGLFLFGQGLTTFAGKHVNQTLLFPMWEVFEDFVTASFRRYQKDFFVYKQRPQKPLACIGGKSVFYMKPDISLTKQDKQDDVKFILDTKWKQINEESSDLKHGISQADMYQLFAYGKKYGCKRIALVYPKTEQFQKILRYEFDEKLSLSCFPFDVTRPQDSVEEILDHLQNKPMKVIQ